MGQLEQALKDYLCIRWSLGFRLRLPGSLWRSFVTFLKAAGASYITTELALRWATQPTPAQPATWAARLGMVRRFASWLRASEPRTEIPPAGLLRYRYRRKTPHIYSDAEIGGLLRCTQRLRSRKGLRAHTFTTLFALLVVTGMRVNEAVGLDRSDVDLSLGILQIRRTKFGKTRHVPPHPSTAAPPQKNARTPNHPFAGPPRP